MTIQLTWRKVSLAIVSIVLVITSIITVIFLGDRTASATSQYSSGASKTATISVTGTGTATGKPDTLTLSIGVSTTAFSAASALNANNVKMQHLQAVLKAAGVPQSQLQTSNLSLNPNYSQDGTVTGYGVQDNLSVVMHNLQSAGAVIDAAAKSVGNSAQIQGISFSISNTSQLMAKARTSAMQDAFTRAKNLANASGLSLGSVVKITDDENAQIPEPPLYAGTALHKSSAVPVQAGTQAMSVNVRVVYQLKG